MPFIDVNDVLIDGFIAAEAFVVLRREEVVGSNGLSTLTVTRYQALGSVVPTGDNSLVRDEAYSAQMNAVRVITSFRLRGATQDALGKKYQPDVVEWSGGRYIVKSTNDYTSYGAGFVEADCISTDFEPPAVS